MLLKPALSFVRYKYYYNFVSIHISLAALEEIRTLCDKCCLLMKDSPAWIHLT